MKYCPSCGRAFADEYMNCDTCRRFLATYEQFFYIQQYYQQSLAAQQYNQQYQPYMATQDSQQNTVMRAAISVPSRSISLAPQKKKKTWGKKLGYAALTWLAVVFLLVWLGSVDGGNKHSGDGAASELAQEQTESAPIEQTDQLQLEFRIYEILDSTKVVDSFAPTVGEMIVRVFSRYDISYELQPNTTGVYRVTVSGDYRPNPEIPYLTMNGKMVYKVDINSGNCVLISDPNNIDGTFTAYIFSSF